MRRISILIAGIVLLAFVIVAGAGVEGDSLAARYEAEVFPLLARNCFSCHDGKEREGGLVLEGYREFAGVLRDRAVFETVRKRVRAGDMPPDQAGHEMPSEDRAALVGFLDAALAAVTPPPGWPGRVALRRLNRTEYGNTVRDLLGIDLDVEADLPADDKGYGFDNIADVLTVSPLHIERYLAAAERALDAAIPPVPPSTRSVVRYDAGGLPSSGGGRPAGAAHVLFSNGLVYADHEFPVEGAYVIRVRAWGDQAGPDPVRAELRVGPLAPVAFEVRAGREAPETTRHPVRVAAGRQRVGVAFVNDYYRPDDSDAGRRDRNLWVDFIEVDGPFGVRDVPPESHGGIFEEDPGPGAGDEGRARKILAAFARRAFRRPVDEGELVPLIGLFSRFRAGGASFRESIRAALTGVLVSPRFLYRIEADPAPGGIRALDGYELASRLSYFLWSTMPDEELFDLASEGALAEPAVLGRQVRRMLADPRSDALVLNFAGQWLGLRTLDAVTPDPGRFPDWSGELRHSMRRETELLFTTVMREDGSVLEFIRADYTFLDERLARHYGIEGVEGDEFRRVSLVGTGRGGLLTHGSILTLTSNPTRTSPVKRGKWILGQILGAEPPPPPADVPALPDDPEAEAATSLRERMRRHREDPRCMDCHKTLDPLGFALENFDAIGRWRERDGAFAIDASGVLPDGTRFHGPAEFREVMVSRGSEFVRSLGERLLTYAIGRGMESWDEPALSRILVETESRDHRFSALVTAVVMSDPFRLRGSPEEGR